MNLTTRRPKITDDTQDTAPEPPSDTQHRIQEAQNTNQSKTETQIKSQTKNEEQSKNKTQNESKNKTRTKIKSGTHLGITISWVGPVAVATGPDSPGGASC
jgi:hypothetical protein